MTLPSNDNLKAKISKKKENPDHNRRLQCLKSNEAGLQISQEGEQTVAIKNKRVYERKTNCRSFENGDIVL
jgi:hypothetical protein